MPVVSGKRQCWTGPALWLPAPSSITLGELLSSLHFRRPQGRVPRFQEAGEGGQGTPAVVKLMLSTRHLCRCFTGTISLVPHNSLFISYTEKLTFGELKNRAGTREWLGEVAVRVPPSSLPGPPVFRWAVSVSSTGHYSHTALPLRLPFIGWGWPGQGAFTKPYRSGWAASPVQSSSSRWDLSSVLSVGLGMKRPRVRKHSQWSEGAAPDQILAGGREGLTGHWPTLCFPSALLFLLKRSCPSPPRALASFSSLSTSAWLLRCTGSALEKPQVNPPLSQVHH